jgi:hypothetical protein
MTSPSGGFETHLQELEDSARVILPRIADIILSPADEFDSPDDLGGPGYVVEAGRAQEGYQEFMASLAGRQRRLCEVIEETSAGLLEIVELYRRVDGQP